MRRRDLLKVILASPAAIGVQFLTPAAAAQAQPSSFAGPADVFNYLRTLQHLKAEFFRQGAAANLLTGVEADYLRTIGEDDAALLALYTQKVTEIGGELTPAPAVAFGDAFRSRESYLTMAFDLTNCCLQGYLGAAPALFSQRDLLQPLLGGFGTQARHAAVVAIAGGRPAAGGIFKGPTEIALGRERVLSDLAPVFVDAHDNAAHAAPTN